MDDPTPERESQRSAVTGLRRTLVAGRVFATFVFLFFIFVGGLMSWLIISDAIEERSASSWDEVDCTIAESAPKIPPDGSHDQYDLEIRYEYTVAGKPYTSTEVRRRSSATRDYESIQRALLAWPAGARSSCFVDPDDPTRAVLDPVTSDTPLWVIGFPLLFVALGIFGIVHFWSRSSFLRIETSGGVPRFGKARESRIGRLLAGAFFSIFFLGGAGFFVAFFVQPVLRMLDSRDWVEVPCRVIRRGTWVESSGQGTDRTSSTHMDVLYEYARDIAVLRANRMDFFSGTSPEYDPKLWERMQPGAELVCFVDPEDPAQAVLDRTFPPRALLGLIPLVFVAVGAAGLVWVVRGVRRRSASRARSDEDLSVYADGGGTESQESRSGVERHASGPVALEPGHGATGKFLALFLAGLFWNGITGVFVVAAIASFQGENPEWLLAVFLVPFVLIGLVLLVGALHSFLALFNPRPVLELSRGQLRLGDRARVTWEIPSRADRIRRLRITLEGREEATVRKGNRSHTERSVFHRKDVIDTEHERAIESGSAEIEIPASSMHSFDGLSNRIVWSLRFHATIARFPDLQSEFELDVLPRDGAIEAAVDSERRSP